MQLNDYVDDYGHLNKSSARKADVQKDSTYVDKMTPDISQMSKSDKTKTTFQINKDLPSIIKEENKTSKLLFLPHVILKFESLHKFDEFQIKRLISELLNRNILKVNQLEKGY